MNPLTFILSVLPFLLILLVAGLVMGGAFFIVHTREAVIIERFGRYNRTAHAGFNFKIPFIETKAATVSLQVQQLDVQVQTKTRDNVFVVIPVAVQFQVPENRESDSYYMLQDPEAQIIALVQDNVRTALASMDLDTAFASKDDIARSIETALQERMTGYGYAIVNTLITDIDPDASVKAAMNEINAATRKREAAIQLAEAAKITQIKAAEADAEARRLQGVGVAGERKAIADGLAEQYHTLEHAGVEGNPELLLMMSLYFDTLRDMARSSNTKVVFLPSGAGGLTDMTDQLRNALMIGNESSGSLGKSAK